MKKIIILLITLIATTSIGFSMNLKEAFSALSNIPNISVTKPDYNLPISTDMIEDVQIAAGYNLNLQQTVETKLATYIILNQVPFSYMINGANNNESAAFIFTTPTNEESNDILIVTINSLKRSVVFMYGKIDNSAKTAIQNAVVKMQSNFLCIESSGQGDREFNIIISKAR